MSRVFPESGIEVLVAGGGPAGFVAAIAGARSGARVRLVERYGFLGGMATTASVGPFMPFFDKRGNKVVAGIADELVERLVQAGGAVGHGFASDAFGHPGFTPFDPEVLKHVALEMVLEAGVELTLHSYVADAVVEGNTVKGIVSEGKSGRVPMRARIVVDATGDADVAARAGVPCQVGRPEDGLTQPPSLFLRVGNVNTRALVRYAEEHPDDMGLMKLSFVRIDRPIPKGRGLTERHFMGGFYAKSMPRAREAGEVRLGKDWVTTFTDLREGEVILNATRVTGGTDCLDVASLTAAEIEGRRQAMSLFGYLKRVAPGYEHAFLLSTGCQIGVRESRRILGERLLTVNDVVEEREFPDGIARCAYGVDIHDPKGGSAIDAGLGPKTGRSYGIPYGILVPVGTENLLVAGRPVSVDFKAHGSIRPMPYCMATGQAAGTAAALAVSSGATPRQLDVEKLRRTLREQNVLL